MSNNTSQLFAGAQADFTAAEADTGGGGVWPKAGLHKCFLNGIEIQPNTKFRMGQEEIDANSIRFVFQLCDDPERSVPLTWSGESFDIPVNPGAITASNYKKKYEISLQRLKGHLSTILGIDPSQVTDIGQAIDTVKGYLGDTVAVILNVDVQERKGSGTYADRIFRTEKVKECIAGPHITPATT